MSSSSSDGVDEAVEEWFDKEFDNLVDSLVNDQAKKPKRRAYYERHREEGHNQLWNDYLREHATYPRKCLEDVFECTTIVPSRLWML
uniref:Uncharacterized protein n=1 Tax=Brassica oleracea TaxID=3712 RepID=A0A3P6DPI7_BRAOL|nr:unnamed protein product [Brassica oleracea]